MSSLAGRLTGLYAASAGLASAGLLVVGYQLLDGKLLADLDALAFTDVERIRTHLQPAHPSFDPAVIATRLRRTTDNSAILFRVEVRDRADHTLFLSRNLGGRRLPVSLAAIGQGDGSVLTLASGVRVRVVRHDLSTGHVALIATAMAAVDTTMHSYIRYAILIELVMLALGATIGAVLAQVALRPLRAITRTARAIHTHNLGERIAIPSVDDEIAGLAGTLNAMFDRIEQGFDQIRRFTADASHELKTPLSLIRLHAERLASSGGLSPAQLQSARAQLDEVAHLTTMIEDLLTLSRTDSGTLPLTLAAQSPVAFIAGFAEDAEVLASHAGLNLTVTHHGEGQATFDARWMRRVLLNLLSNAIRATGEAGGDALALESRLADGRWHIALRDRGQALDVAGYARIFDRFVTRSEGGTGLGLAICRSVVTLHGGTIGAIARDDGPGSIFWIALPAG